MLTRKEMQFALIFLGTTVLVSEEKGTEGKSISRVLF